MRERLLDSLWGKSAVLCLVVTACMSCGDSDIGSDSHDDNCNRGQYGHQAVINAAEQLAGLEGYTVVKGGIHIECDDCTNLDALHCLTSVVAGIFEINNSPVLTSVQGLSNLRSVEESLIFAENRSLTSLAGLDNLDWVGALRLEKSAVTALTGVDGLASAGILSIIDNAELTTIDGLGSLASLIDLGGMDGLNPAGLLEISNNPKLTGIDGLGNLTSIELQVSARYNPELHDCEFCRLFDQLVTVPSTDIQGNLDDSCTPVRENCPPAKRRPHE